MKALGRMIDDVFSLCSIASNKTNCDNFTKSAHLQGRDCRACPFFFFFLISFYCRKLLGVEPNCCRFLRIAQKLDIGTQSRCVSVLSFFARLV